MEFFHDYNEKWEVKIVSTFSLVIYDHLPTAMCVCLAFSIADSDNIEVDSKSSANACKTLHRDLSSSRCHPTMNHGKRS